MAMTETDLRAVADAAIEQFGEKYPNLKNGKITIRFRNCRSACAYWYHRLITLPKHLLTDIEARAIHTIIHELAHIAAPAHEHHGPTFRAIEIDMHQPWGLVPADYARAYCRKLYQDGKLVWEKARRVRPSAKNTSLVVGDYVRYRGKKRDRSSWYGRVIKINRVKLAVAIAYPSYRRGKWRIPPHVLTRITKAEYESITDEKSRL